MLLVSLAFAGPLVDGETSPAYRIADGKGVATLLHNSSTGADAAALTILSIGPGGQLSTHVHDTSVEILYVMEGELRVVIAGQAFSAGPGDAVYIPANTQHIVEALASVKCVQVFVQPGPEQRYISGEKALPMPR